MKCSSQRNCNRARVHRVLGLNQASMKCSSQRNCNTSSSRAISMATRASMKCSSQRNCNGRFARPDSPLSCLNEVQFPKELQLEDNSRADLWGHAPQ